MQNKHGKTIRRKHRKCQVWGWFGKGFGRGLGGFGKYKNMLEKKLRKRMIMPPATVCCSWALPIKGGTSWTLLGSSGLVLSVFCVHRGSRGRPQPRFWEPPGLILTALGLLCWRIWHKFWVIDFIPSHSMLAPTQKLLDSSGTLLGPTGPRWDH